MKVAFQRETLDVLGQPVKLLIAGNGPPMLLLHGGGGAALLGDFAGALSRSFTVFLPLHPGFGGTPLPHWARGIDDLALHYAELIRQLSVERPAVVGHSLGGWIATELAVFRPESIQSLALVSAFGVRPETRIPDLMTMSATEVLGMLFANRNALPLVERLSLDADAIVRMYQEAAAVARLMLPRPYEPKLRYRLRYLTCPTLVVWGDSDRLLPASHGEKILAQEIAGARFQLITGAGHALPYEAPEELAEIVEVFATSAG